MNEIFFTKDKVVTGLTYPFTDAEEEQLRYIIEEYRKRSPLLSEKAKAERQIEDDKARARKARERPLQPLKESVEKPLSSAGGGFLSPAELRQSCIDWILKNEVEARKHADKLKDFLDGVSNCPTYSLTPMRTPLSEGLGTLISALPATCPTLCEAFQKPALREYRALDILNSAKTWFIRVKDSVLGWEFDKVYGLGGDTKRFRVKAD